MSATRDPDVARRDVEAEAAIFWAALRGEAPGNSSAWPRILSRARREGVIALLAASNPHCPGRDALRRDAVHAHLSRIALVRRAARALDATGLPWVALKGLTVAVRLYPDPTLRPSGDLDVLVRPADRENAERALVAAGFQPTAHHRELFVGEAGEVDLHVHAINRERVPARGRIRFVEPDWLSATRRLATEAGDLPVLDDDALAVFLSLHLVHHHGGVGARWILDLHRLLAQVPAARVALAEGAAGRAGRTAIRVLNRLAPHLPPRRPEISDSSVFGPSGARPETPSPAIVSEPEATARPGLLDRITARAAFEGTDVPGLRFLHTLRELPLSGGIQFLRETVLPPGRVLDAVAATGTRPPLRLHVSRFARTAISLSRLAWQALNSRT